MRRNAWLLLFLVLMIMPLTAQDDNTFQQTQFDALFQIGAERTTAMYSFNYIQPQEIESFRWLFPIPPDATRVELGAAHTAPLLDWYTEPIIEPPQESCKLNPILMLGDGREPWVEYLAPDDAQITRFDSPDAAFAWLGTDAIQDTDTLREYDAFVGVTITPQTEFEIGDINNGMFMRVNVSPLVMVEYPGTDVFLPMNAHAPNIATRLDNYAQSEVMPVTAYIFDEVAYAPSNYESVSVDLTQLSAPWNNINGIMRDFDGTGIFFNRLDPHYYALLREAISEANGLGFITEFRQDAPFNFRTDLRNNFPDATDLLNTIAGEDTVLTRLRTFIDTTTTLPAPMFDTMPSFDPLQIDLSQTADPARFFGCTTRTLYDPDLEATLPEGRTYIDTLNAHVAHPADWSLYTLDQQTYAFAPEAVTLDTLRALERGEDAPPMLVLRPFEQVFEPVTDARYIMRLPDLTGQPFTMRATANVRVTGARNALTLYYPAPESDSFIENELETAYGMHVAVVSTHADFAENQAFYVDLLDYIATRQFWLSPMLRHTLFMYGRTDLVTIGYPEDWIETLDADRRRVIVPIAMQDDFADAPYVREVVPPDRDSASAWIRDRYGLAMDTDLRTLTPFEANGRTGYIQLTANTNQAIIEISAPDALYDTYAPILTEIAETMRVYYGEPLG